jgi:6-methylsalicylic acid synthase
MLGAAGALSTNGICISFDDDAHGYARGEGAAVFVLNRLSDAILDGDNVLATLKGSAIAQDGKTNGIMAPNAKAQELVARKALKQAGVDPYPSGTSKLMLRPLPSATPQKFPQCPQYMVLADQAMLQPL